MDTNEKFEIHFTSTLYKRLNAIYDYILDEKNKIIYISNMYHSDQDYLKYN